MLFCLLGWVGFCYGLFSSVLLSPFSFLLLWFEFDDILW